jgi:hypothetical protein
MVVHVPSNSFGQVLVFTLGEDSWREVAIPCEGHGWTNSLEDGLVTIQSTVYWAVKDRGRNKVVSFHLDAQQIPSLIPLPSSRPNSTWRLAEVLGRLAIVFSCFCQPMEVWVMEHGARWRHWYSVQIRRPPQQPRWHDHQDLTWPQFVHGTKHILTCNWLLARDGGGCALYAHTVSNDTTKARYGTVEINVKNPGTMVAHIKTKYFTFNRFDYVETMEPLSVYKCW